MVLSGPLAMAASDAVITLVAFSASFRLGTVFYSRFLCRESEPRQYVGCLSFFFIEYWCRALLAAAKCKSPSCPDALRTYFCGCSSRPVPFADCSSDVLLNSAALLCFCNLVLFTVPPSDTSLL